MSERKPHLLYVITDLELGGVPLHLYRLARAMRDRGWRITVASLAGAKVGVPGGGMVHARVAMPVGKMLREAGLPVYSCNGRGGWDYHVVGRLADIIREVRPDVIHSFLFHANTAVRFAALSSGFPRDWVICEIQTVEVERRWHLWVDRFTHRLCRFTIGNSPSVIDHLHRYARIPLDRLRLVRGGVDVDRIRSAAPMDRASLGLQATDRIVLWVGRLDPVKGLDVLIRAFEPLARETNAHLLLVGGGALRDGLERLVRERTLESRVYFLGPRTDVPSLLKTADLFVFPSRTEGLPNALLEAMAAGCPIVTTDVPGCRDLITHEESGLLVPYGDTSALAGAMRRLLCDQSTAGRFAEAASRCVFDEWNQNVTFDSYEGSYREVLEKDEVSRSRLPRMGL
ncbi:MAG: glycosyltransferase [Phycisphaerales bacterium]|nr:glycosyltransferase [Phycisphaerales bacterium]